MSGLNDASCQLSRVRRANSRPNFGWPGTRTKYAFSTGLAAYEGYESGGLAGAGTATAFGLIDFGVESGLSSLGPGGAVVAIGYSQAGGSQTIWNNVGETAQIEGCNAAYGGWTSVADRQYR